MIRLTASVGRTRTNVITGFKTAFTVLLSEAPAAHAAAISNETRKASNVLKSEPPSAAQNSAEAKFLKKHTAVSLKDGTISLLPTE